jgi:hypothetical protein
VSLAGLLPQQLAPKLLKQNWLQQVWLIEKLSVAASTQEAGPTAPSS